MTSPGRDSGPFVAALGAALDDASPAVRRHLALSEHSAYAGSLRRLWRRGLFGRLAARALHVEGDPTDPSANRFELRNDLVPDLERLEGLEGGDRDGGADEGAAAMTWVRTHGAESRPVRGVGLMRWMPRDRKLVDVIGTRRWMEVELAPRVVEGAVVMSSVRQWARVGRLRVPLPRWLVGGAVTREWEEPDGRLGLSLTLSHPLFGDYAGYEAVLERFDPP